MTTIADSSAFRDGERLLPQHHAALTLLQERLSAPGLVRFRWLDLACGRGQIILSLDRNLSPEARAKIQFWAFDLDQTYARETSRIAERVGFGALTTNVGELSTFDDTLPSDTLFDFITLTNAVHEIEPRRLATLFANSIRRLSDTGTLYIYDMERISPLELGAVPWSRDDVRRLVHLMLDSLGISNYRPENVSSNVFFACQSA